MSGVIDLEGLAWSEVLGQIGGDEARNAVVAGRPAPEVIEALVMGGGPAAREIEVTDWSGPRFAEGDEVRPGSVDMVLLLRAWGDRRYLETATRTAREWLRPGGTLVLGELASDRLISSVPRQYPSSLLYRLYPSAVEILRRCTVTPADLEVAMIRTGMDHKRVVWFDRPVGVHRDIAALRTAAGGWRGVETLDDRRQAELRSRITALPGQEWPLVETEPWVVVAGRVRS